jgi:hypothetical protein
MLGGSFAIENDSMRDRYNKLLPQTHSPGVYYSLFIMEMMEILLERLEVRVDGVLAPFALQFPLDLLCFMFMLLWYVVLQDCKPNVYIGSLRSR